jgi:hypothetical protein
MVLLSDLLHVRLPPLLQLLSSNSSPPPQRGQQRAASALPLAGSYQRASVLLVCSSIRPRI